jgi:hypothetical protein
MLSLQTNPVQLIEGSPTFLMNVYNVVIKYVHGSTPFNPTSTDILVVYTGDGTQDGSLVLYADPLLLGQGFIDQSEDLTLYVDAWFATNGGLHASGSPVGVNAAPASSIVDSGLYLSQCDSSTLFPSGANWTQGNGSLEVTVEYSYLLA